MKPTLGTYQFFLDKSTDQTYYYPRPQHTNYNKMMKSEKWFTVSYS